MNLHTSSVLLLSTVKCPALIQISTFVFSPVYTMYVGISCCEMICDVFSHECNACFCILSCEFLWAVTVSLFADRLYICATCKRVSSTNRTLRNNTLVRCWSWGAFWCRLRKSNFFFLQNFKLQCWWRCLLTCVSYGVTRLVLVIKGEVQGGKMEEQNTVNFTRLLSGNNKNNTNVAVHLLSIGEREMTSRLFKLSVLVVCVNLCAEWYTDSTLYTYCTFAYSLLQNETKYRAMITSFFCE